MPFLADTGILDAWGVGDELDRSQGETPSMLAIVFVVRLLFCWTQLKIRHYQRRDQPHDDCPGRTADGGSQPRLNGATRSRRPSKSVLYFWIAESRKPPSHMRYLAVGLFCWQQLCSCLMLIPWGKQVSFKCTSYCPLGKCPICVGNPRSSIVLFCPACGGFGFE